MTCLVTSTTLTICQTAPGKPVRTSSLPVPLTTMFAHLWAQLSTPTGQSTSTQRPHTNALTYRNLLTLVSTGQSARSVSTTSVIKQTAVPVGHTVPPKLLMIDFASPPTVTSLIPYPSLTLLAAATSSNANLWAATVVKLVHHGPGSPVKV